MPSVETQLTQHFNSISSHISAWRNDFDRNQCLKVGPELLPPSVLRQLHVEARDLLKASAERRDVRIESTGNTNRNYQSVGRDAIREFGTIIPALFESEVLLMMLGMIAGERVHRVPYAPEEYIINNQKMSGDTHGWHWDDYAFALIHVVDSPDPLLGGRIEYIPNVLWDKNDSERCIREVLEKRVIHSMHVQAGETYFMKTNTTLHRVSPLSSPSNRIAIVYSFASDSDLTDSSIDHSTMEAIYPKDTNACQDSQG